MDEIYRGTCPFCSGQLNLTDDGEWLVCENGRYKTRRAWFEGAWNAYDELCKRAGKIVDADPLIAELRKINHSDYASETGE